MLIQLPEEKKESVIGLFKNRQPNNSALWCYFEGKMPGRTFVDNADSPSKAICRLDMSWTYISDGADFKWIEETLREIIRQDWIQVIWVPSRRGIYPLQGVGKVIPRFEYTERIESAKQPRPVEISPFTAELFDKLETGYKNWHLQNYGSKEEFLKKTYGFYAVENGEICCECESAFTAKGFTEIGIYTFEKYRRQGYAFAACLHTLKELDEKGLKAIWACDAENLESVKLAESLGFVNPVEYDFIYFPHQEN
ncbi:MAG: GNAT family N-acetyltransferase [Treponemataceae bacterium]|nr:GNAT family N-acetyltransferase [Treponemataceae bacterium]